MDLINNKNSIVNKKIRLLMRGLIFYLLLPGCNEKNGRSDSLSLQWEGNKATGIIIPRALVKTAENGSLQTQLKVYRLSDSTGPAILGEFQLTGETLIFQPLIPLTRGLKYQVTLDKKNIGEIEVPLPDKKDAPHVVGVYPSVDTVPQNLLKIYIQFSAPMEEGTALQHIRLIKDGKDTLTDSFLDLHPELWNSEHSLLTLWFDPGRIKRDLQPNRSLGAPLVEGHHYKLIINGDWKDIYGSALGASYQKELITGQRDGQSPDIQKWDISLPLAGTKDALRIDLLEALDYVLLNNAVRILNSDGSVVEGNIKPVEKETKLSFIPSGNWKAGTYHLEVEDRLEDLAGNNLQRLFDNDVTVQVREEKKGIYKRSFVIK